MLIIRGEQMAVLERQARMTFLDHLVTHMQDRHGDKIIRLSDGEHPIGELEVSVLYELLEAGVGRARRYEISWMSNIAAFVVIMFLVAPNFDEDVRVRDLLLDRVLPPDDRIDVICAQLTESDWNEIRERYDVSAWGSAVG